MNIKLTPQDIRNSTLLFGAAGVLILALSLWLFRGEDWQGRWCLIAVASALFWGALAFLAFWLGWNIYYQYFYPGWVKPLAPFSGLLYACIGLGLWLTAVHIPGPAILWFVLLGATEGVLEHWIGITSFHILEKVPWLQDQPKLPLLVFSFFEYMFYWDLVVCLTALILLWLR